MAELTDSQIEAALLRGRTATEEEPRAVSVHYDRQHGRIVIELTNGCMFAFPPRLAQGLEDASEDQLSDVRILGSGYGLHWPYADVDLSVPGLLAGALGTSRFMARRAGQTTSPAKAAASRRNGARGGRPRKAAG